jgi:hypothetical protein
VRLATRSLTSVPLLGDAGERVYPLWRCNLVMAFYRHTAILFTLAALLTAAATNATPASAPAPVPAREKTVWNYDGGIFLDTEGALAGGLCFRVVGRVTAHDFFDDLKRIDAPGLNTIFRRGKEAVTQFPSQLLLQFVIHDFPCAMKLQDVGSRNYLTRAVVSNLRLSLYWKRGLELRPISGYKVQAFHIRPIIPFNVSATDLPEKLEWSYEVEIPSEGVPLTDSLVLIIRTPDDQVAARVAARM